MATPAPDPTQDLTVAPGAAEAEVPAAIVAQSFGEYTRASWARIRSGDSGVLPVVVGLIGIMVVFWTVFPKLANDYDANWWSIFFNLWARLWGSVVCLFAGFWLARFAILRLIFHPLPPEKEKKK